MLQPVIRAHFERLLARHSNATLTALPSGASLVAVPGLLIPAGWTASQVILRFLAPNGYPVAAPDCFWVEPVVKLANGKLPKNSQDNNPIRETSFKGHWFSWHAVPGAWSANNHDLLSWLGTCLDRLGHLV
jgi:E2/UBC family protein E